MAEAAATALPSNRVNRRLAFVRWVRRTHGWFGLWGALLGLMTGTSGIWLNHRSVLKLELPDQQQINAPARDARPAAGDGRGHGRLVAADAEGRSPGDQHRGSSARGLCPGRSGAARAGRAMQPERWTFVFGGPNKVIQVEYWVGNKSVGVRTTQNGFIATLTNLHKGTTMPVPWILLIDTLAGSLIFLSISGAILWWETHRRRLAGLVIFGVSVAVTVALAMSPLQW